MLDGDKARSYVTGKNRQGVQKSTENKTTSNIKDYINEHEITYH